MTGLINLCMIGSAIYCAGTAVIRYIYIRTSLQQEVNEAYKRTKFLYLAISTGGILCIVHVGDFYHSQHGKHGLERCPLMLYRACLEPASEYSLPLYKLLPLHQGQMK